MIAETTPILLSLASAELPSPETDQLRGLEQLFRFEEEEVPDELSRILVLLDEAERGVSLSGEPFEQAREDLGNLKEWLGAQIPRWRERASY